MDGARIHPSDRGHEKQPVSSLRLDPVRLRLVTHKVAVCPGARAGKPVRGDASP